MKTAFLILSLTWVALIPFGGVTALFLAALHGTAFAQLARLGPKRDAA